MKLLSVGPTVPPPFVRLFVVPLHNPTGSLRVHVEKDKDGVGTRPEMHDTSTGKVCL
jgi:hypothetical protein